jgi:hypothetical protein
MGAAGSRAIGVGNMRRPPRGNSGSPKVTRNRASAMLVAESRSSRDQIDAEIRLSLVHLAGESS